MCSSRLFREDYLIFVDFLQPYGGIMTLKFGHKLFGVGAIALAMLTAACGSASTSSSTSGAPSTLTACHVTSSDLTVPASGTTPAAPPVDATIKGMSLKGDGSSALQPLAAAAASAFDAAEGTSTSISAGGSGQGLSDVEKGNVQIGDSDIFYQDKSSTTGYTDLVDHRVAVVAFALVESSDLSTVVENLTSAQIANIYNGTYTNWNQVGGPNEAITVVNRPVGSGTRASFEKYVLNGATNEVPGNTLTQDSTGALVTIISQTKGAIGYASTGFVLNSQYSGSIFPVCIDGFGPTATNINTGSYKFWNYEHMYTKGAATPYETDLINYIESSAVQTTLLPTQGFLQISSLTSAATATHPLPAGAQ
jgi:phosphate transport system substrate-binding protein